MTFPSFGLRLALTAYQLLWWVGTPIAARYIYKRAKNDPDYGLHLPERYGRYDLSDPGGAVWIHAVSLGEFRSALPLIRLLLARKERVLITHFTPAGRRESERVLAAEIAAGTVRIVWVPFDSTVCLRRFFTAFRPKLGLVMEIEIWPGMIMAARRAGVPLYMCNAQYPSDSYKRDSGGLRAELMQGFAGAFVKSELQQKRFASVGVKNMMVTGELRFDQPIPPAQLVDAVAARLWLGAQSRHVVTIASAIEGEDTIYIAAIRQLQAAAAAARQPAPLFIYVPRRPERFDEVASVLTDAGLKIWRRSQIWPAVLNQADWGAPVTAPEVLLGDSLGEMYFYLAMADQVVVGGGFNPKGAHNIIEPLALKKPVVTGPYTQTIEYPMAEAAAAGVASSVPDAPALAAALIAGLKNGPDVDAISRFFVAHAGAAERTVTAIASELDRIRPS